MPITAHNLGPEIYRLFHMLSEGLQGKEPEHGDMLTKKERRKFYLDPLDTIQTSGKLNLMLSRRIQQVRELPTALEICS